MWLALNSSPHHFGLHQERNVRVAMELEVPKRPIFRPTSSIVMVQWVWGRERQKRLFHCKCQGTMAKKNVVFVLIIFFCQTKGQTWRKYGELSFNAFEGKSTESPSPSKVSPSFSVSSSCSPRPSWVCPWAPKNPRSFFCVLLLFPPYLKPIRASNSKLESNFSDARNMLTKKPSGWSQR